MIGIKADTRGLLELRVASDLMKRDIKQALKDMSREYLALVAAALARPKSGRLYGERLGVARYREVKKRVTLFGGQRRTVRRRERIADSKVAAYRASAPGEAPAMFTGNLLRSLRRAFPSAERGFGAKVFAARGIGPHRNLLEFGTGERVQRTWRGKVVNRRVGRVLPRPIWTPTQEHAIEDLNRRLLAVIDASIAFRGGGDGAR